MSDWAFTMAMLYAGWSEPNIRCELFVRQLEKRSVTLFGVHPLAETLWYILAVIVIFGALGYAVFEWIL